LSIGDVVYLEPLGQPIVILGSLRAAIELLEKRGGNVSDRPQSQMTTLYVYPTSPWYPWAD
jgi:hypothetical protein